MLQQFTTSTRAFAASAALLLLCAAAPAAPGRRRRRPAGDRRQRAASYTVQKGDTLWGISGKFLKDPWRWPDVWRMNRDQIRNPHRIYPGRPDHASTPATARRGCG